MRKKLIIAILILTVIGLGSWGYLYYKNYKKNYKTPTFSYMISGVPYTNEFLEKGISSEFEHGYAQAGNAAFFASAILSYWHQFDSNLPNPSFKELYNTFQTMRSLPTIATTTAFKTESYYIQTVYIPYLKSLGFSVDYVQVKDLSDFEKYINAQRRTPLVIYQSLAPQTLYDIIFIPLKIIVGFDDERKIITLHDFYLGPNYEISFDAFKQLWNWGNSASPQITRSFWAIYPPNYEELLKKDVKLVSPKRTSSMDELAAFNIRYYQALYAWTYKKNLAEAAKLFESLLGDLNKSNPVSVTRITMFSYISLANIYKSTGEYQKSIDAGLGSFDYVSKLPGDTKANVEAYLNEPTSESVNKSVLGTLWNLVPNKSFSWDLWNLVGSDYEQLKNYDQAIAAYQKALAISDDPALRQKIEELSKKK